MGYISGGDTTEGDLRLNGLKVAKIITRPQKLESRATEVSVLLERLMVCSTHVLSRPPQFF